MYRQTTYRECEQTRVQHDAGQTCEIEESEHREAEEATERNGDRIRGVGTRAIGGRITHGHECRGSVGSRIAQMMEERGPVRIENCIEGEGLDLLRIRPG